MPTIMQVFITLLFIFENWSIRRAKQQVQPTDPNRSIRQDVTFRRAWSCFMITASFLIVILFSVVQLNMISLLNINFAIPIILIIIALIILYALALSFWAGQGGSRLERSADYSNVRPVHDDDKWLLGMIYFNRKDSNLFVEKRFGVGWGLNFGHPISWLTCLGIIVLLVGVKSLEVKLRGRFFLYTYFLTADCLNYSAIGFFSLKGGKRMKKVCKTHINR